MNFCDPQKYSPQTVKVGLDFGPTVGVGRWGWEGFDCSKNWRFAALVPWLTSNDVLVLKN